MVRVFTFSFRRLSFVCSTINSLKSQTLSDFHHHLHLLSYTDEQIDFVRRIINDDPRFHVTAAENLNQKENLFRLLTEMPLDAECYIRMDDDDVYDPHYLELIRHRMMQENSDLTAFKTLLRYNIRTGESFLIGNSGLYGSTMCLSSRAVAYLRTRPNWTSHGFEDSWMDKCLADAGFKRDITSTPRPLVIYVQHATNISNPDIDPAPALAQADLRQSAPSISSQSLPLGPPDSSVRIREDGNEDSAGLYENGQFVFEHSGRTGTWEVTEEGRLLLEFSDTGRLAEFSMDAPAQRG